MERLNKYIASCGVCSRRKSDELISSGKVKVNGQVVTNLGEKVSSKDIVEVDNKLIQKILKDYYYLPTTENFQIKLCILEIKLKKHI